MEVEAENEYFRLKEVSETDRVFGQMLHSIMPLPIEEYDEEPPILKVKFVDNTVDQIFLTQDEEEKLEDLIEAGENQAVIDHLNEKDGIDLSLPRKES